MDTKDHTKLAYITLADAYAFYNKALFRDELPHCLITMQRHRSFAGYYGANFFRHGEDKVDEIAMNPQCASRPVNEVLSTLVHEMVHCWQQHFGKPGKNGYHNKQWGEKMKSIGLQPTDTGYPGGKETGTRVTHMIVEGGKFAIATAKLLSKGEISMYVDCSGGSSKKYKKNKTIYICPDCKMKVWGKPDLKVQCYMCSEETDEVVLCKEIKEETEDEAEAA
jgi:SprT-like family